MADTSGSRMQVNRHAMPPMPVELPTNSPKFSPLGCSGDIPSPRSGHTALIDRHGAYMYVFGGYHDGRCFNDLYRLHLASCTWQRIECTGDIPTPRVSHQAVIDADYLMVFGGSNVPFGQSNTNDFYVCDLRTFEWTLVQTTCETTTDMPSPRYGHTMVKRRHELYVFAGTAGCVYYNDLFRLDLATLQWSRIVHHRSLQDHTASTSTAHTQHHGGSLQFSEMRAQHDRPNPRYRHEAVATEQYMWVIGGGTPNPDPQAIEVFSYHFGTNTWTRCVCKAAQEEHGIPIARRSHTCVLYDNKVYMFGGVCSSMVSMWPDSSA